MKRLKENYDYMLIIQKANLVPVDAWPKPKAQKPETAIKSIVLKIKCPVLARCQKP